MRSCLIAQPSAVSVARDVPGHRGDLPGEDTELSTRRRRIYKAYPACGWRASWSRAHSPRVYHTSYPVPVRRPALLGWASFRPCLTTTPLSFAYPSAPHKPGVRTLTSQALCHARHTRRANRQGDSPVRLSDWLGVFGVKAMRVFAPRSNCCRRQRRPQGRL